MKKGHFMIPKSPKNGPSLISNFDQTNQGDNLGDFIDSSDNQRANDKYLKEFKELKERQAKQSLNSTVRSNQLDQTVIDDSVLGF